MISVSSALSAFSIQFGPWDVFCMTTGGMHDNGGRALVTHLPEPVPEPHKVMADCDVHIHLGPPT
ncbi:hypothetical protein SBA5_780030 [Candidatus Sulfotelmatomonas gaucii]|uniref:Uncharacterized protein n=1 Tax=Candidatus Sulfuritelmatomonas gaucii TaxID=2043161 RepID=A0A2N9M4H6_9BACT|nr:hypothetical protein SBA5_780030 [Candidatus Sulfotelmatomonas gaucii]